jgi:hypothetical protein
VFEKFTLVRYIGRVPFNNGNDTARISIEPDENGLVVLDNNETIEAYQLEHFYLLIITSDEVSKYSKMCMVGQCYVAQDNRHSLIGVEISKRNIGTMLNHTPNIDAQSKTGLNTLLNDLSSRYAILIKMANDIEREEFEQWRARH